MSGHPVIPDEAVEAAWDTLHENPVRPIGIDYAELTAALEAAAPHILAAQVEAKSPKHQCEPWQIQVNGSGTYRYCAACGEPQP